MFIKLFLYANNKKEAKKISEQIMNPLKNYAKKIKFKRNKVYWKIKEIYVVEIKIIFNSKFNKNILNEFLYSISDDWVIFEDPIKQVIDGMLASNIKNNLCIFEKINMVNIFFDSEISKLLSKS